MTFSRARNIVILWLLFSLAILAMLFLTACDRVVSERDSGPVRHEIRQTSCTYAGWCWHYGYEASTEKSGYKYGYSFTCSGSKHQQVQVTPTVRTHESGKKSLGERVVVVADLTTCH